MSQAVTDITPAAPVRFQDFLREEFLRRCRKNRSYNLSAFARSLKVDVSTLAKIMKGQRRVGKRAMAALCTKLGLSPDQVRAFQDHADGATSAPNYQQLTLDSFRVISDWYHYAILELMGVKAFRPDTAWVARTLGISVTEVQLALERLQRLEIIEMDTDGNWRDLSGGFSTTIANDFTAAAFRRLQQQILERAITALEETDYEKRSQTSMTMAINPAQLSKAREMIQEFRRGMNALLSESGKCTEVYQLSVSLYPITEIGEST